MARMFPSRLNEEAFESASVLELFDSLNDEQIGLIDRLIQRQARRLARTNGLNGFNNGALLGFGFGVFSSAPILLIYILGQG